MLEESPNGRRLSLLMVEDHPLLRKLFSEAFGASHDVHTASCAGEGWKLYLDSDPDIVFLDIGLPDMNGHDLAKKMKRHNSRSHVIMATVSDDDEDLQEAARNNADGFIRKPFDKQKIEAYIDRYLAGRTRQ
ncbi:MAG: response regulator [Bdellovibrionales bacterium]